MMKLTALCMYPFFLSLFWTTVGSGQGHLSEDKGSVPCTATLQLEESCGHGQEDAACPYSISLPAMTVHLPSQLRDLERIMKELQDLKDTVDQLRKKCADCTVSQTEKMCDMQTEKEHVNEKLNEKTDKHEDEWGCVNERSKGPEKVGDDFGTGRIMGTKALGDGEINTEKRTKLEGGGRNKWQAVKERNQGLVKEMEGAEISPEVTEKDGKSQEEGVTVSGNLAQSTTLTANWKTEVMDGERVAEKNNSEKEKMDGNKNKKLKGDKGETTESKKEREKNSDVIITDKTVNTSYQQQSEENEDSERIKTSEDYAGHTNNEQEQQGVDSKENVGEEIKVWQNNKKLKPTENNEPVVKGKTINSGERGETDGETGAKIKTKKENVVQGVLRPSDEELTSNKAKERKDFVSVSQTPPSITSFIARRHKTIDPNKVITLTSSLSSTPLWSSPHTITDVSEATVIAALGLPSQSTDFERTQIYERPRPGADASFRTTNDPTTTPTSSTLEVPRQQISTITNRFTSTASPRSRPDIRGQARSTLATKMTSTRGQHFFTTTMAAVTERSSRGAKNTNSSTKTGKNFGFVEGVNPGKKEGMKPKAIQKLKNSKNDHKHDRAPFPDKKTEPIQKLKPVLQKPTVDPNIRSGKPGGSERQAHVTKPDQRVTQERLTTGGNQKNNSPLGLDKGQKLDSNQTSVPPDQRMTSPHRTSTVGTTGSSTVRTGNKTHQISPYNEKTTNQNTRNISPLQQNKGQRQNSQRKVISPPKKPTSNQTPATVDQTGSDQDPVTTPETENYNKTSSGRRTINQNVYKNPLPKQDKGLPTDRNRLNVQKPHFNQKAKTPVSRPTYYQRPTAVNTTRYDKSQIIKTSSKPDLITPVDKVTTLQNPKNISLHKQTKGQNPNFNRNFSRPVQRPTTHNRLATGNLKGSAKDPRREKYPKPDHSTSHFKITPHPHLKNNSSLKHEKDLKPNIHQMPLPPVRRPTPHQKSAATNTDSSEPDHLTTYQTTTTPGYSVKVNKIKIDQNMKHNQYPILDKELTTVENMLEIQKENSHGASVSYESLIRPTSDQTQTTTSPTDLHHDPVTEVHSVTDQTTLLTDKTTDRKFINISLLKHEKGQRSTPHPQPEAPVRKTTFLQWTATVNTTGSDKVSGITPNSNPDRSITDRINGTIGKNLKKKPVLEHDKDQKTNSSPKSLPPAQRPTSQQRPGTRPITNPRSHQKTKSPLAPESERVENAKRTVNPSNRSATFIRNYNEGPSSESEQSPDTTPGKNLSQDGDNPSDQQPRPVQKDPLHHRKQELNSDKETAVDVKPTVSPIPRKQQHDETPEQKTLPDEISEPRSSGASTPRPPPAHRPALQPGATSVQRPEAAVRRESSPNNKTDSNPYLSGFSPDGIHNSRIDLPPTSGPLSQGNKMTHSTGDTEFNPSKKSFNLSPTSSPEKIFPLFSGLLTESPNSRATSDLRPQTARQLSLIPITTRPNIMIRGILPSVITSTTPGSTELNSNTKPSAPSLTLHSAERTAPEKTSGSETLVSGRVPHPGAHTSSILSPDTGSTTSVTFGPQVAAAEYSTPSARELRVKINQVAAFPSDRHGSTGPLAGLLPKQHPADNNKEDGADYRKWTPSKATSSTRDCSDHLLKGRTRSGVYTVTPDLRSKSFPVFCDMDLTGGGWTLLQRRLDGSVSFNRTWADYRAGFGQLDGGEFWLGNNLIHLLTRDRDMVLRVELEDFDGVMEYAEYEKFKVASERLRYRLTVGGYSGTAGDALRFSKIYDHNHKFFTTPDRDNDRYPSGNCGAYYSSGWWFDACMSANLNGRYYTQGKYKGLRDGIFWGTWHNITSEYYPTNYRHSFKTVKMMIRPKGFDP